MTDTTSTPGMQSSPQQPNVQPPRQGSSAVKIILIVVAVIVALGIGVVGVVGYGFYRISKAVHKDLTTGKVSIDTPNGTLSAISDEKLTEADLGTAIYPGAEQSKGSARLNLGAGPMVTANFLTPDHKEKVIAFVRGRQLGLATWDVAAGPVPRSEKLIVARGIGPGQYGRHVARIERFKHGPERAARVGLRPCGPKEAEQVECGHERSPWRVVP